MTSARLPSGSLPCDYQYQLTRVLVQPAPGRLKRSTRRSKRLGTYARRSARLIARTSGSYSGRSFPRSSCTSRTTRTARRLGARSSTGRSSSARGLEYLRCQEHGHVPCLLGHPGAVEVVGGKICDTIRENCYLTTTVFRMLRLSVARSATQEKKTAICTTVFRMLGCSLVEHSRPSSTEHVS